MNNITLQLDVFEGPLDLLLYLIKKHDLEISRVSVAKVTDQYLLYLEALKELDVDLASDFLYMASELAYLKSRTLLPTDASADDEQDEEAGDLIARLKQYELYKMAALQFKKRPWLNRDIYGRGAFIDECEEPDGQQKKPENKSYEVDSFELIKAFYEVLNRLPQDQVKHHVSAELVSVTDRIYEFIELLKQSDSILFTDMFKTSGSRSDIVVSFLAILEMAKLKLVVLYQVAAFEPIRLKRCIEIDNSALTGQEPFEIKEDYR
ncbi:MAG: segregation/condensation protein A [Deltaproteobacteria bacterium]|nr:segregation/condensation protein A [Deltaproteobacteria bacterium]